MRFLYAVPFLLIILFSSCNKSSSDSPNTPTKPALRLKVKSMIESYNDGSGWKTMIVYNYTFDSVEHSLTINRYTTIPPINRKRIKFFYYLDNKRISKIVNGYYTPEDSMNLSSSQQMVLDYTTDPIAPYFITSKYVNPPNNVITYESTIGGWYGYKTSTGTYIREKDVHCLIGLGEDSMYIKAELDYAYNNVFLNNIPGYKMKEENRHKFLLNKKQQCTSYEYQNGGTMPVPTQIVFIPTAERKISFSYNAGFENSEDSIFKMIDPAYNNPWTWLVDHYSGFREPLDYREPTFYYQNIASSYSDSLFTISSGKKQFFSVVNYNNEFFKDSTGRISSVINRNSKNGVAYKLDFYYEN